MAKEPNTLFLISRHGLLPGKSKGLLESWMWNLTPEEESMKFLSLHRSKSERAYKGGEIVSVRLATEEEVSKHQELLRTLDKVSMQDISERKIIVFRVLPKWNKLWPKQAKSHQMAYKGVGYVEGDT